MRDPDIHSSGSEKKPGTERKVVLAILFFLILLEVVVRLGEGSLSKDIAHFAELPAAASRMAAVESEPTLLIVGNSLAREGIDAELVREKHPNVEFFYPDGSSVSEWEWGLKRYFFEKGAFPDRIWVVTGRSHLIDASVAPEKLGAYLVGKSDFWEAFAKMQGHEEKLRFVIGKASHLFANRNRIRPLIGYRFFPGFEKAWPKLAVAGLENQYRETSNGTLVPKSLGSLARLLDISKEVGSEVTVVAIPMLNSYEIPDAIQGLLKEREIRMIDLSHLEGIDATFFPDDYHLSPEGAVLATRALLRGDR